MDFYQLSQKQVRLTENQHSDVLSQYDELDLQLFVMMDIQQSRQLIAIIYPQLFTHQIVLNVYKIMHENTVKKSTVIFSRIYSIPDKQVCLKQLTHLKCIANKLTILTDSHNNQNIQIDCTLIAVTQYQIYLMSLNDCNQVTVHCNYNIMGHKKEKIYNCQIHIFGVEKPMQNNSQYSNGLSIKQGMQEQQSKFQGSILVCGKNKANRISLSCFSMHYQFNKEHTGQKKYDLQLIYHELINSGELVMEFNKHKTPYQRKTAAPSFQYQFNLSVQQLSKQNISILLYPSLVQNFETVHIFEWKYCYSIAANLNKITGKIQKMTSKPRLLRIGSLHSNLTLRFVKRLYNTLALCYTMHQIKPQLGSQSKQFETFIMVYETSLGYTKNIIILSGVIRGCYIETMARQHNMGHKQADTSSRLVVVTQQVSGLQQEYKYQPVHYLTTNIIFPCLSTGLSYNPHFTVKSRYKPIKYHNNSRQSYVLGLLKHGSQKYEQKQVSPPSLLLPLSVSLTLDDIYNKKLIYWSILQQLQFMDHENSSLIENILGML